MSSLLWCPMKSGSSIPPCAGTPPAPSFADGLYVQRVMDAVERSSAARSAWTEIAEEKTL